MKVACKLLILYTLLFESFGAAQSFPVAPPKCALASAVERLNDSKAVFTGRVRGIQESEGVQVVKFQVIKSWKSVHRKGVTIVNYVHHEGPYFRLGQSYLVFAYERQGKLATGGCSGTMDVRNADLQINELDKWRAQNEQKRSQILK